MFELSMPRAIPEEFAACHISESEIFIAGGHDPTSHTVLPHTYLINSISRQVVEKAPLPNRLKAARL